MQLDRLVIEYMAVGPRDELLVAVLGLERGGDVAGGDVECGEQGRGAVAVVVVRPAFDPAFLHGQDRHRAVPGLDWDFLSTHSTIADSGTISPTPRVEPADLGDLPDEFGVVGEPE